MDGSLASEDLRTGIHRFFRELCLQTCQRDVVRLIVLFSHELVDIETVFRFDASANSAASENVHLMRSFFSVPAIQTLFVSPLERGVFPNEDFPPGYFLLIMAFVEIYPDSIASICSTFFPTLHYCLDHHASGVPMAASRLLRRLFDSELQDGISQDEHFPGLIDWFVQWILSLTPAVPDSVISNSYRTLSRVCRDYSEHCMRFGSVAIEFFPRNFINSMILRLLLPAFLIARNCLPVSFPRRPFSP
jgi:hypothetical protein